MAVRCTDCGHEMSDEVAAAQITDMFPPLGTAGGGPTNWVTGFLAAGCSRNGIKCPVCKKTERWDGTP